MVLFHSTNHLFPSQLIILLTDCLKSLLSSVGLLAASLIDVPLTQPVGLGVHVKVCTTSLPLSDFKLKT